VRSIVLFVDGFKGYTNSVISILESLSISIDFVVGPDSEQYKLANNSCRRYQSLDSFVLHFDNKHDKYVGLNGGISYLVPEIMLQILPCLNIHPSVLPMNRGSHQSFWAIMDDTPFGATLHWMDSGLDTGPILDKISFSNNMTITAAMIQSQSLRASLDLLKSNILTILQSSSLPSGQLQDHALATSHKKSDLKTVARLNLNSHINVSTLLRLARATSAGSHGLEVYDNDSLVARIVVASIDPPCW
jgi:folate-dependent phosphoribosylglycinamide formyltransferase PurN